VKLTTKLLKKLIKEELSNVMEGMGAWHDILYDDFGRPRPSWEVAKLKSQRKDSMKNAPLPKAQKGASGKRSPSTKDSVLPAIDECEALKKEYDKEIESLHFSGHYGADPSRSETLKSEAEALGCGWAQDK